MRVGQLCEGILLLSKGRLKSEFINKADEKEVSTFASLEHATESQISFLAQSKLIDKALASRAGVLVVYPADAKIISEKFPDRALVVCANPYAFFAYALQLYTKQKAPEGFIDPKASVAATAKIAPSAVIEAGAVVKEGALIGERVHLFPGAYVGAGTTIGDDSIIYANVAIYHGCKIGKNVIIHSGATIGADGFGFAPFAGEWVKIPQIGGVEIKDDVEIGANTTIDRGALEDTVVGVGTKLDNQIQLGHNVRVGDYTVMAACTGVAGSTKIGSHCMIGGASNINGHIEIPDAVQVGPTSNIMHWEEGAKVMASYLPAQERRTFERNLVLFRRLTQMHQTIKELQSEVQALKK